MNSKDFYWDVCMERENITGFSEGVQGADILLSYTAAWTFYTQMLFYRLDVVLTETVGSKQPKMIILFLI